MSQTIRQKGKLKLIPKLEGETLEQQCKRVIEYNLNSNINNYEDYYNSYEEQLLDEFYNSYYSYHGNLYELEYEDLDCSYDFAEGNLNEDGSIDFHVMYYNGGASLSEILDEVMKDI